MDLHRHAAGAGKSPQGRRPSRTVAKRQDGFCPSAPSIPTIRRISGITMAGYEEATGGSVLAIAHNGNVSNGLMFPVERLNGEPVGQEVCGDAQPLRTTVRSHPDQR